MQACTCSFEQGAFLASNRSRVLKPLVLLGKVATTRRSEATNVRRFTSNLSFAISIPSICVAGFIVCLLSANACGTDSTTRLVLDLTPALAGSGYGLIFE